MSKNKRKSKSKKAAFETSTIQKADSNESHRNAPTVNEGRRWYLIAVFIVIAIGGTYLSNWMRNSRSDVPRFTYEVVNEYPHDPDAFTQGFEVEGDVVWESTGKYDGESSVRKVDLQSGDILKKKQLPDDQFGEGLATVDDKIYQLTWKENICHVYDRELNEIKKYEYRGQGWGLTYDGKHLIMTGGTSRIKFLDPDSFEEVRSINVRHGLRAVGQLNELEYTGGKIYANVLGSDNIYAIDPADGTVLSVIELKGLWTQRPPEGLLNGIAVDSETGRIFVTGKYCPKVFEIKIVPKT